MGFDKINFGFKKHLQNVNEDDNQTSKHNIHNTNIYSYSDKFKNSVRTEESDDISIFTMNLNEMSETQIANDKLVHVDDMDYENVKTFVDYNHDGIIENAEVSSYISQISSSADNNSDLSFEQLSTKKRTTNNNSTNTINEINNGTYSEVSKAQNTQTVDKNSYNELFGSDIPLNVQYITDGDMPYMLISPSEIDKNAELPLVVYLHGAGGNYNTEEQGAPKSILNWDFDNFNGYILCPLKQGALWANNNTAGAITELVDTFTDTHKVKEDNISLVGFSSGATGALYLATKTDIFSKVAIISSASKNSSTKFSDIDISSINIPIKTYSGTAKNDSCYKNTASIEGESFTVVDGVVHGRVAEAVFNLDEDSNNRSDILEWLAT